MRLYYVRHGDPIYHPDGLTEFGFRQAELCREQFERHPVGKVFSSTSNRAILTSLPTCRAMGLKGPVMFDWANEGHIGEFCWYRDEKLSTWCWNVRSMLEKFHNPEVQALGNRWFEHPLFSDWHFKSGFETFWAGQDAFMESLGYRHDRAAGHYIPVQPYDKNVAFFAHGGCGMVFMSSLLDIPFPQFVLHFTEHVTTGISAVEFEASGEWVIPRLTSYDATPHLFKAGIENQFGF